MFYLIQFYEIIEKNCVYQKPDGIVMLKNIEGNQIQKRFTTLFYHSI